LAASDFFASSDLLPGSVAAASGSVDGVLLFLYAY
jgi:hypothetical protein